MKAAIFFLFFFLSFPLVQPAILDTYSGEAETLEGFSLVAQSATTIELGRSVSTDGAEVQLDIQSPVYGLALSGSFDLQTEDSLVRILLVDISGNEHLVLEAYPLLYGQGYSTFEALCEETCALDGVMASSLKLELYGSSVEIERVHFAADKISPKGAEIDPKETQKELKSSQEAYKIKKLNEQIRPRGLAWTAGETEVSKLGYNEKKRLLGLSENDPLPNLQGFEYYIGGVFEFQGRVRSAAPKGMEADNLPEKWDWRNRHNENWITLIEYQGDCGSCWAFSGLGAAEAVINLYYNQHLDVQLSKQDAICQQGNGCKGSLPEIALSLMRENGIVEGMCFPYVADDGVCDTKCPGQGGWKIDAAHSVFFTDAEIKKALIEHGPLTMGTTFKGLKAGTIIGHAMVIVGYRGDEATGDIVWILKNSWGLSWGENGYGYVIIPQSERMTIYWVEHPFFAPDAESYEISCVDKDHDNYCNWGISEARPSTCPSNCAPEKDCDDSNSHLGAFTENLECSVIDAPASVAGISDDAKGCCVNPNSRACEPITAEVCCPDVYGDVNQVGPISKQECLAQWFFPSEKKESCALMDPEEFPNADYCMLGCCCFVNPEFPLDFDYGTSTKAECSGQGERWIEFSEDECAVWMCADAVPGLSADEGGVSAESKAPSLVLIEDQTAFKGELLTIQLLAEGSEPISYSATGLPDGATLDPSKGVFRWVPDGRSEKVVHVGFGANNDFGEDYQVVKIEIQGGSSDASLMWGLIGAIVLAVIALIACFFGLASLVAGIIGVAGVLGLIIGGAIAVLGAGVIGFALGWLLIVIL